MGRKQAVQATGTVQEQEAGGWLQRGKEDKRAFEGDKYPGGELKLPK